MMLMYNQISKFNELVYAYNLLHVLTVANNMK